MPRKKAKEHYDEDAEGNWVCKYCRHVLAKGTSSTRMKSHLSGEEGHGVKICKEVPPHVQQSVDRNKRQKTIPPQDVDVGVRHTISSSSREQPNHFDNGAGMQWESQHLSEPPELGTSLLAAIGDDVDFDNGGEMLIGFQHQSEPTVGEQRVSLQSVEEFVAPKSTQGDLLITTTLVGEDFQKNMDEIWTWLLDDNVTRIGIWGMAGVGKTALAKHVHNRLLHVPNPFEHVYWVTVSHDFTVHKLQDSIGKALSLDLSNEDDEHKRAAKLSKALDGGCKKCVFILDDVWSYIPLYDRVGLPASTKLILTSRSLDVCRMIGFQKKIKMKPLSGSDGWQLFKQTLGQEAEALPSEVMNIARLFLYRCGGLPPALIWMAISMREVDDKAAWINALENLKNSTTWQENKEVFQRLKLSYDYLNDSELQRCFLFCAFYLGRTAVEKEALIECLIDEGVIRLKKSKMTEFEKGHMMLKKLENACLLEKSFDTTYSSMNFLMWDLACQVLSASCTTKVETYPGLEELPDVEEWTENLVRVSLMDSNIVEIPSGYTPRCPNLLILLLRDNWRLDRIADSFFEQFYKLKVLDFSLCNKIEKLPDSISNLVNLTTLLLSGCYELRHVPSLARLRELKRLDLRECYCLVEMPEGVGSLSKLKYLNLSASGIKEIPSGIIPKLTGLLVLKLINSHGEFLRAVKVEGKEVGRLRKLEILECHFKHISEYVEAEWKLECPRSLRKYSILIGSGELELDEWEADDIGRSGKEVLIKDCSVQNLVALPSGVQAVSLWKCHDLKDFFAVKNTTEIQSITLTECDGIEILVLRSQECNTLKEFKHLNLYDLKNFRGLIPREDATSRLYYLRTIKIWRCHRVKRLIPSNVLPDLFNLQQIDVRDCDGMEEIFAVDEEAGGNMGPSSSNYNNYPTSISPVIGFDLQRLTKLTLRRLPKLRSIYKGAVNCHSLEEITLVHCPKLNRIPLSLPQASLKRIQVYPQQRWESLEWDNPNHKENLQPLCVFDEWLYG